MTDAKEYNLSIKDEGEIKKFLDQRELKIRYEIPVGDIYPFFEGLRHGKLMAPRCSKCGKLFFPPQANCPECRSNEMEWVALSGEAKLLASTKIFVKPVSFENEPPYIVAIGRLKEGINVLSWLVTDNEKDVKVGASMKLMVTENKEGNATYLYKLV